MPFTPSHAVVALAFSNGRIPAAAVAIGAMVPDIGLFLPGAAQRPSTHSLLGIVTVDLLLGAAGLLLWTVLLAPAWRDLAPWGVRVRLRPVPPRPLGLRARVTSALLAAAGLVIGSTSHVLWDGFTHEKGPFVAAVPLLQEQIGPFAGYTWAQYLSGVLGLLGLGVAAVVWYATRRPHPLEPDDRGPVRLAAWTVVLAAAVVPAGVVLSSTALDPSEEAYRSVVVDAAVAMVTGLCVAALSAAGLWRLTTASAPARKVDADPS